MMQGTQSWCSVTTCRDGTGREVQGVFRREGTHMKKEHDPVMSGLFRSNLTIITITFQGVGTTFLK